MEQVNKVLDQVKDVEQAKLDLGTGIGTALLLPVIGAGGVANGYIGSSPNLSVLSGSPRLLIAVAAGLIIARIAADLLEPYSQGMLSGSDLKRYGGRLALYGLVLLVLGGAPLRVALLGMAIALVLLPGVSRVLGCI